MDALTKWKLKKDLNYKEALEVLTELYGNAKKSFSFSTSTVIDKDLWKLYNDFETNPESNLVLSFGSEPCQAPYVSLKNVEPDKLIHEISAPKFTIYVFE